MTHLGRWLCAVCALLITFTIGAGPVRAVRAGEKADQVRGRRPATVLYRVRDGADAAQTAALSKALAKFELKTERKLLKGRVLRAKAGAKAVPSEEAICAELVATGAVAFAEPDYLLAPVVVPNDFNAEVQWHHSVINSPAAWDRATGTGVVVAVCDTGVDTDHPDLVANLLEGYNAVDGLSAADGGVVEDEVGHGTQTAGTVGAVGNNGKGVVGVAWDVKILPIRVSNLSSGSAYLSDMAAGVRYAADNGAKVVNLSYGGADSYTIDDAARYLRDRGGLLFMSAGNDGREHRRFPDFASFVCVGATNPGDERTSWSSYGSYVDIVAPGQDIGTTAMGGGYSAPDGTSFSSPCAAGVAALIFSIKQSFTPAEVGAFIFSTCRDLGPAGEDKYTGMGRVDAGAAVLKAWAAANNAAPKAAASTDPDPAEGLAPLPVAFDGSASSDLDGAIVSYSWDFGDGTGGTGAQVTHTYEQPGFYTATLTVTDEVGATDVVAVTVDVSVNPDVLYAPSDLAACATGSTVTLVWTDNSASEDGFYVERGVKVRGKTAWGPAGQVGADVEMFTETMADGEYRYRVRAFRGEEVSGYSNEATVEVGSSDKPPKPPKPPKGNTPVEVF